VAKAKPAPEAKAKPKEKEKEKPAPKQDKVVRDSFSMPKSEHASLKDLRSALARKGRICTKSELLRAGVQLVTAMKPAELLQLIDGLAPVAKGKRKK